MTPPLVNLSFPVPKSTYPIAPPKSMTPIRPAVGEAVVAVTEIEISQHASGVDEAVVASAEINRPIDLAAVGDALDPIA